MSTRYVMRVDTPAWRIQVWTSFAIAVVACGWGMLQAPSGELDRAFLAIGLLVSSLVTSQMIAAIVSLFIGLLFIAGMWSPELDTSEMPYRLLFYFSVPMHFERHFARGLLDTRHLVLYGTVALFALFLTVRSLESRRWR